MGAPKEPGFYVDLDKMAQRVGAKSEDLLLVWSSETGLNPGLAGNSRTISTLMQYSAVPVIGQGAWDKLPTMTAQEQLPYIEQVVYTPAHKILGRSFSNAFETYLSNAAPGLLRSDGHYNEETVMYAGSNYPDNWAMDNAPAGVQAAQRDHVSLVSLREAYPYAQTLVSNGTLKGYVSLGDLKSFAKRVLSAQTGVFNEALGYLTNVRKNVAAGLAPSIQDVPPDFLQFVPTSFTQTGATYVPDLDSGFSKTAPLDTRVASPSGAKKMLPKSAPSGAGTLPQNKQLGAVAVGAGLVAVIAGTIYLVRK